MYVYSNGTTIKLVKKGTTIGGTVDAPGWYPATENQETGIFAPSGKISSCRFYAPQFRQEKRLMKLDVSFALNGGTIALDMRTNDNETFTELRSWTGSDSKYGETIYAESIPDKQLQWVEYRVRITR